jgi:hypothetical protein
MQESVNDWVTLNVFAFKLEKHVEVYHLAIGEHQVIFHLQERHTVFGCQFLIVG